MQLSNLSFILVLFVLFMGPSTSAQSIIFEVGFDTDLQSSEGESPTTASNMTVAEGFLGDAISVEEGGVLQYDISSNITSGQGSLSLWVKPNWSPGDTLRRIFVVESNPVFEMHVDESSSLVFAMFSDRIESRISGGDVSSWNLTDWHFLVFNWSETKIEIYVDGILNSEAEVGFEIPAFTDGVFNVGSLNGENAFTGLLDELKIYNAPLSSFEVSEQYKIATGGDLDEQALRFYDIFGRDVTTEGLTLVDWEGPVGNPAMKYFIRADESFTFPLSVRLTTGVENTYFNLPSEYSPVGPSKTLVLDSAGALDSFLFATWMDENFESESFDLILDYSTNGIAKRQLIPVQVIDQDYDRDLSYPVTVDFSEAVHPLMVDPKVQELIRGAAEDWLYFIDGEGIDEIPIGGSSLEIGGTDHFFEQKTVTNPVPYKGYYLYAYGNSNSGPYISSTGFPNREQLQSSNGEVVPIFRIGSLHLNVFGEGAPTGWEVLSPYENWTIQGFTGIDMYSLVKHEIGHAMVFENSPLFLLAQGRDPDNPFPDESVTPVPNGFTSPSIAAYYPDKVVPLFAESLSHLFTVIDPASQMTPYGGGVDFPVMPSAREMLTKLDILIMESVGYPLRDNEVTKLLSVSSSDSFDGDVGVDFEATLHAEGGIPVYDYTLLDGVLPLGLSLDRNTGEITGIPEEEGEFPVSFIVKDYDQRSIGATFDITIRIGVILSSQAELINFNFDSTITIIETNIDTSAQSIYFQFAQGTEIDNLIPLIQISEGASISPSADVPQDFTNPITYTVVSEDGNVSTTWTIVVNLASSVDDHFKQSISIYPNPADTELVIEAAKPNASNSVVQLFNLQGQLKRSLNLAGEKTIMPLHDLSTGIYFLTIVHEDGISAAHKIMIERQ